jgi:hypothetical protein
MATIAAAIRPDGPPYEPSTVVLRGIIDGKPVEQVLQVDVTGIVPLPMPEESYTFTVAPKSLTKGQIAIIRLMQAGNPLGEGRRHYDAETPTFDIKGNKANGIRKSAIAALVAHGLIERGAEPAYKADAWTRHDTYLWSLTAKGKEF